MSEVPSLPVSQLPADVSMLDVREDDEWTAGHAPGARHVPMSELAGRLSEIPEEDPLYVVCRSGGRSSRVVSYLVGQGFPAVNVDGGMQDWAASGRTVVTDDGSAARII